jgi:DNA-binding NarL/FixJ family response regulator
VLVVDDDPTARRALREAIAAAPDLAVAGEVSSGAEAVAEVTRTQPDVVIIDAQMPEVDGVTATLRVASEHPETRILVLSTVHDDDLAMLALRAGAAGFISKEAPMETIVAAARAVGREEAVISGRTAQRLIDEVRWLARQLRGMRPIHSRLTTREWQVVDLLSQGATTDEIADRLVLSADTVRTHVKHILRKLGAHSRAEAVAAADELRTARDRLDDDAVWVAGDAEVERLVRRVLARSGGSAGTAVGL